MPGSTRKPVPTRVLRCRFTRANPWGLPVEKGVRTYGIGVGVSGMREGWGHTGTPWGCERTLTVPRA